MARRGTSTQRAIDRATGVNINPGMSRVTRNAQMRGYAAQLRAETGQNWRAYTRYNYVGVAGSGSPV